MVRAMGTPQLDRQHLGSLRSQYEASEKGLLVPESFWELDMTWGLVGRLSNRIVMS